MERLPRTGTAVSLGRRTPRKRARVSLSCPVTLSTSVLSSSPFSSPASGGDMNHVPRRHAHCTLPKQAPLL